MAILVRIFSKGGGMWVQYLQVMGGSNLTYIDHEFMLRYLYVYKDKPQNLWLKELVKKLRFSNTKITKALKNLHEEGVLISSDLDDQNNIVKNRTRGHNSKKLMLSNSMNSKLSTAKKEISYLGHIEKLCLHIGVKPRTEFDVSFGSRLIFAVLLLHADEYGFVDGLSEKDLAKITGLKQQSLKRAIKELRYKELILELYSGFNQQLLGKQKNIYRLGLRLGEHPIDTGIPTSLVNDKIQDGLLLCDPIDFIKDLEMSWPIISINKQCSFVDITGIERGDDLLFWANMNEFRMASPKFSYMKWIRPRLILLSRRIASRILNNSFDLIPQLYESYTPELINSFKKIYWEDITKLLGVKEQSINVERVNGSSLSVSESKRALLNQVFPGYILAQALHLACVFREQALAQHSRQQCNYLHFVGKRFTLDLYLTQ